MRAVAGHDLDEAVVELRQLARARRPCPRRTRPAWRRRPSPSGARGPALRTFQKSSFAAAVRLLRTPEHARAGPRTGGRGRRRGRPAPRPSPRRTARRGRRRGGPRRSRGAWRYSGLPAARSRIIRSSISTATGPVATISASRSSAAGIVANERITSPCAGGIGTTFSSAAATTASVPSDPTISRARLNAHGSSGQPSGRTGRPGTNSSRL